VPRAMPEPGSVRPVVRRAEEQTVYTGRRAILRNSVVVMLSAVAVTTAMMGIMRWKESHRPSSTALAPIVEAPLPPSVDVAPPGPAPTIVIVSPPPPPAASVAASLVTAPSASSAPKRVVGVKRVKEMPPAGSLDDLNREISH
jgi:hypothetical protein